MNPWDIFAWVGSLTLSALVVALAAAMVKSLIATAWERNKHKSDDEGGID